jgi:hypothetical protein
MMSRRSGFNPVKLLVLIAMIAIQCDQLWPATAEPPKRRPEDPLNVVDAKITSIRNKKGEKIKQVPVKSEFEVQGTFRVPGGVETGPPPTVIRVRDGNGIIHGETGMFPEFDGKDGYTFRGSIDTVAQPGKFKIEVRVLGQDILTKNVKFVKN